MSPKILHPRFQIAEKQGTIASLSTEIASITANIDTLKADLKEKKTALKKIEKEVATLEAKKAKADAKAAPESVLKKLLASGMSADEILEKLKKTRTQEKNKCRVDKLNSRSSHDIFWRLPYSL